MQLRSLYSGQSLITILASQTICSGNTPVALDAYSPTGGDGSYSYQWQGELQEAGQIFQALRALVMLLVHSQKIQNSEE